LFNIVPHVLYITSLPDISASDVVLVDLQLLNQISSFVPFSFIFFFFSKIFLFRFSLFAAYFDLNSELCFRHNGTM